MKKSMKIFSLIFCLALVLTIFAACGKTEKKEDETKASTTESTTVETTTETPKGDATHDGRLIGLWNGVTDFPLDENGTTGKLNFTIEFKEDGTMVLVITKEATKALYVEMLMKTYNFKTEAELDAFFQNAMGKSLDEFLDEIVADFPEEITANWETEDNNKLYEMEEGETKEDVTVETYTVSEDGNTIIITTEDEEMGMQTMTLTRVVE